MKQIKKVKEAKGFTIIEVALVLAIAGLIFLVVFLALPALQNSQKDTAAKEDVGRIVSALQSYSADNQGNLPTAGSTFAYAGASNLSQIKTPINVTSTWSATPSISSGSAIITINEKCDGGGESGDAAVQTKLTNGTIYCANM